ncbi:MAG TPA: c-type cytochrome [Anaerolineaceae bacterium]|nr:c-type cytochrome [Anaerolineaceae bacterium]
MAIIKRLIIVLVVLSLPLLVGLLFTMDIIKIDWISNMEIQPNFRSMEDPLPLPPNSIPVQGAAYITELGPPANPVEADDASREAGKAQYDLHCALCHGPQGQGNGPFASFLQTYPPADLTADSAQNLSDGAIFLIITNGIEDRMPALHQNIPAVEDRWHVVNYVRQLQGEQ